MRRDPGSVEVQPRYDGGRIVRFAQASDAAEIAAVAAAPPWAQPRVLFAAEQRGRRIVSPRLRRNQLSFGLTERCWKSG